MINFLEYQAPNKRRLIRSIEVLVLNFKGEILKSLSGELQFLELNQYFLEENILPLN